MAAPLGYEAKALNDAMWACTGAMIKNDGSKTNKERFWEEFSKFFGEKVYEDIPAFDAFYANEFHSVKDVCCGETEAACAAVAPAERSAICCNSITRS